MSSKDEPTSEPARESDSAREAGSIHAGQVLVADGTIGMADRIARVLTNAPGIGVTRHADVGNEEASKAAVAHGIHLPMERARRDP